MDASRQFEYYCHISDTDINNVHCKRSVVLHVCGAMTTTFSYRPTSSGSANKYHKQTYIIWISYKIIKSGKYTTIIFYLLFYTNCKNEHIRGHIYVSPHVCLHHDKNLWYKICTFFLIQTLYDLLFVQDKFAALSRHISSVSHNWPSAPKSKFYIVRSSNIISQSKSHKNQAMFVALKCCFLWKTHNKT
jgi:hypothetical protein